MAHLVETMAYAGQVPWHGLGTKVSPYLTPDEILEEAGLNWDVDKVPLQTITGIAIPDKYALVRVQDQKALSVVGEAYKPVQNVDAMGFFKRFVEAGRMTMETAGSLDGGRRIWGLARMKSTDFALANDDKVEGYLLLSQPHIAGIALSIMFTPIRVVCNNTLTYALNEAGRNQRAAFRMAHTSVFSQEVQEKAIEVLGLSTERMKSYRETAEFLRSRRATKKDVSEYFLRLMQPELLAQSPDDIHPDLFSRSVTRLHEVVNTQPGADLAGGTWWNAFNAITYYLDHLHGHSTNVRLRSGWFGHGASVKHRALGLASEYAKDSRKAA